MASRLAGEEVLARLSAQHAVARELLRAETLEEAAEGVLAAIATVLGWEIGCLYEVPLQGDELRWVEVWDGGRGLADDFRAASAGTAFTRGAGLPGRTWARGELSWTSELATDPDFLRWPAAARAGLQAGVTVPVPTGDPDSVLAVMEFFTSRFAEPDAELHELLAGFADQLAQFIRRRRAEATQRDSAALNSAIVASALDCVVTMDHRGCVAEFNPAAERTFGYRREEAVGRELADLIIPPESRERHRDGLRHCVATGEGPILDQRVELTGLRADGSRLLVELTVTRIHGTSPPMFTGYLRDIGSRQAAEHAQRHLATIVESSEDAILSTDLDGVVTSWNEGAERLTGHPADEVVGHPISLLVPHDRRGEDTRMLERVRQGERLEVETQRLRADGARIDVSLTVSPITGALGEVTGASLIGRDITARKRAAHAQEFLAAASAAFDASLDPGQTLRTIARMAVPELAELCVIDLLRDDGSLGTAIAGATDPALAAELESLRRRFPLQLDGRHPVVQVLRSRRSLVLRDLAVPAVVADVAQSDEHRDLMRRAGYNSAAVAPLIARGRLLGTISLLHVSNDLRYDASDLALLDDLASRAAMAFDNARLYAERTRTARTLQRSLLPAELPSMPGFTLAAAYQPAGEGNQVGGDFYDVFECDGEWMLIVGDVCGKGAEAAAVTSLIRNSVRALALDCGEPADILAQVNHVMLRHEIAGRFATAVLARLSGKGAHPCLRLAVAGHPPPLVVHPDGGVVPAGRRGDLLGTSADAVFEDEDIELGPGDRLLLYTDGVLEAGAPSALMGMRELESLLARCAGRAADEVVRSVEREALRRGGGTLRDDLAILVVAVT